MTTRITMPELFHVVGAPIVVDGKPRTALRWMLHPSVGLPKATFQVWRRNKNLPTKPVPLTVRTLLGGTRRLTWSGGAAARVIVTVTAAAGQTVTLRAYGGPLGDGPVLQELSVAGPVSGVQVVLVGPSIGSATASEGGTIGGSATVTYVADVLKDGGWALEQTVGLPVDGAFAGTGYPLGLQGPVGALTSPQDAAVRRLVEGMAGGWPALTDRGAAAPPFEAPDPSRLVYDELETVLALVRQLLATTPEPSAHAAVTLPISTQAPQSVHGAPASPRWQAQAEPAQVHPLGALLAPAATDTFCALALGFGTTVDRLVQQPPPTAAMPDWRLVTVVHLVQLPVPPFGTLKIDGELSALYVAPQANAPAAPTGLAAPAAAPADARLDPPPTRDGRWTEAVTVSWARPSARTVRQTVPTAHAVVRAIDGAPLEPRLERRAAGGWMPTVTAADPRAPRPDTVTFTDTGLAEVLPGDSPVATYAVAAVDWFGRWSPWASADHPRLVVQPPAPAVGQLDVDPDGTVRVELVWDWRHRSPSEIEVQLVAAAAGDPAPAPHATATFSVAFGAATPDAPPPGVELLAELNLGDLRTYRVAAPAPLALALGAHAVVQVTATARATTRLDGRRSGWSPGRTVSVADPTPPPPPEVPEGMWWASIPDPRGVARATVSWTGTAPQHTVYLADETALRRELGLPSADLEVPAAVRLLELRAADLGSARRAFRRLAGPIAGSSVRIELPRGSKLIHLVGIAGFSATGIEGPLPDDADGYIAVAAPRAVAPEPPRLLARERDGAVTLTVEVPETRVPVGRLAVHRARSRVLAPHIDLYGPPIAVFDGAEGIREGEVVRFTFVDPDPGPAWRPVFYRAVAHAATDLAAGVYGGPSEPTRAVEVVVGDPEPPVLGAVTVAEVPTAPDHRLVSFACPAPLVRTPRGAFTFAVHAVTADARVEVRRAAADGLPLLTALPAPAEQPDTLFRQHPTDPPLGLTSAWVPRDVRAVIVEITDPAGRSTRHTWTAP